MKTRFFTCLLILLAFTASAQKNNGSDFIPLIGKGIESAEVKDMIANYPFTAANSQRYLSNKGVELIFKADKLEEVRFYRTSTAFGDYTGTLPNKVWFGMTYADLTQVLGKPSLAYNSGYYEYQFTDYVLSCWFEGGVLNQVVIAVKA